jgi:3-oxoacyl-[acyl-carrier protein] reductase
LDANGRLAGKIALVTGSSRGLGRHIALGFAREGAIVHVTYRADVEAGEDTIATIRDSGGQAHLHQLDVTRREQIRDVISSVVATSGGLDVLVNNAGVNRRGLFEDISDDDWDWIMDVNLKGPFMCCQEAFPVMKQRGSGRIINIASVAGQYHGPKTVHYAVSKAGLISLTKVVARYGAQHDILVNAVAPGLILTDQTRDEIGSEGGQRVIDMTLLGRPGQPGDVVSACLLLASDEQSYITGQVISVSGGAYLGS